MKRFHLKHFGPLLVLLLAGCAAPPLTHGIPNLAVVEPGVYRGGQPTAAGWDWLRLQGVTMDVKLNTWAEAPEPKTFNAPAPIWIDFEPITLEEQMFGVNEYTIESAVQTIVDWRSRGVFVHCEHGQDRTGLVIAAYRLSEGWSKAAAEKEMLAHGFHKELPGLWRFWKHTKPEPPLLCPNCHLPTASLLDHLKPTGGLVADANSSTGWDVDYKWSCIRFNKVPAPENPQVLMLGDADLSKDVVNTGEGGTVRVHEGWVYRFYPNGGIDSITQLSNDPQIRIRQTRP